MIEIWSLYYRKLLEGTSWIIDERTIQKIWNKNIILYENKK